MDPRTARPGLSRGGLLANLLRTLATHTRCVRRCPPPSGATLPDARSRAAHFGTEGSLTPNRTATQRTGSSSRCDRAQEMHMVGKVIRALRKA